ncbi:unnamed protein product [Adineta ricciae]|uniref:SUEL-type lectin domain-containing protein n=1 Tax=Adineta ricciae TaxID=249248 RepID=A0A816GCC1_ADIRI|nr:unnamed protein product [Adineta ricciae]
MYGRTSQRICNHDLTGRTFEKTCANIEQSKYQTKLRCQDKSTCQMLIDNQIFTDPCGPTIPKHFEVHYRCINKDCSRIVPDREISDVFKELKKTSLVHAHQTYVDTVDSLIRVKKSMLNQLCLDNQQIIGFVENVCLEEHLQGFHWVKTPINTSQSRSCPSPCHGIINEQLNVNVECIHLFLQEKFHVFVNQIISGQKQITLIVNVR